MKYLERAFLSIICLLLSANLSGQQADSFFTKSIAEYASKKQLSYNATYSYFNNYKSTKADRVVKAKFAMLDSQYYWNLGNIEIQKSKRFISIIDHESKTLMVDKSQSANVAAMTKKQLDSMMNTYDSLKVLSNTQSVITYRIFTRAKGVSYMDIAIIKSTGLLQSMRVFFMDFRNGNRNKLKVRNRLDIQFQNMNSSSITNLNSFSYKKYFHVTKGEIKPTTKFVRYEIINHLNQ